jgi:hypothetical protein
MQLNDVDDLPFHQAAAPFQHASTSDVHFNDGYYFGAYCDGLYVSWGLRLHPNTNVMDGWAGYAKDGVQTVARFSRALRPDYDRLQLGPLTVGFPDPMREVIAVLAPTDAIPMSFDLRLTARTGPFLEAPHQHRKYGHVINDLLRYSQHCHSNGTVTCEGQTIEVDEWMTVRDHSWGIRSAMGPRTPHGGLGPSGEAIDTRRFRLWVHFEIGDAVGFFHTHEDEDGATIDFEGEVRYPDGRSATLVGIEHELEHFPGTNNFAGGAVRLLDAEGGRHEYRIELVGTPVDLQGFGYHGGWHDGGNAGVFRSAELHVETDSYPADPALGRTGPPALAPARRLGSIEYPCSLIATDGTVGRAHVEHNLIGRYAPYLEASLA